MSQQNEMDKQHSSLLNGTSAAKEDKATKVEKQQCDSQQSYPTLGTKVEPESGNTAIPSNIEPEKLPERSLHQEQLNSQSEQSGPGQSEPGQSEPGQSEPGQSQPQMPLRRSSRTRPAPSVQSIRKESSSRLSFLSNSFVMGRKRQLKVQKRNQKDKADDIDTKEKDQSQSLSAMLLEAQEDSQDQDSDGDFDDKNNSDIQSDDEDFSSHDDEDSDDDSDEDQKDFKDYDGRDTQNKNNNDNVSSKQSDVGESPKQAGKTAHRKGQIQEQAQEKNRGTETVNFNNANINSQLTATQQKPSNSQIPCQSDTFCFEQVRDQNNSHKANLIITQEPDPEQEPDPNTRVVKEEWYYGITKRRFQEIAAQMKVPTKRPSIL